MKARGRSFFISEGQITLVYFFKYTILLYPNACYHNFHVPSYNKETKSLSISVIPTVVSLRHKIVVTLSAMKVFSEIEKLLMKK